jgi:hypothetical protein
MNAFRLAIFIAWIVVVAITVKAVAAMGMQAGGDIFLADFAHPWRAQFNGDLITHLLLMGAWVFWREQKWPVGLVCGVLAALFGGMFSLAYIFVTTFRVNGDMRRLLLGKHA